MQWHPTILSRMAIVDQRVLNSYAKGTKEEEYKDGDLVIRFPDCAAAGERACETQSLAFAQAWRRVFAAAL